MRKVNFTKESHWAFNFDYLFLGWFHHQNSSFQKVLLKLYYLSFSLHDFSLNCRALFVNLSPEVVSFLNYGTQYLDSCCFRLISLSWSSLSPLFTLTRLLSGPDIISHPMSSFHFSLWMDPLALRSQWHLFL